MSRVQEQLEQHSTLRFNNPHLAQELKAKAEQHLEVLMRLAQAQQEQYIQGNSSGDTSDLQQTLHELQVQLDLEQQAMVTATSIAKKQSVTSNTTSQEVHPASRRVSTYNNSSTLDGASAGAMQELNDDVQQQLASAKAQISNLQQQLEEAEARAHSVAEELSEHRELQMAYDAQCQDLYRLRMQLQSVRTQGNDAASLAAMTAKQHKQVRMACLSKL